MADRGKEAMEVAVAVEVWEGVLAVVTAAVLEVV